MHSEQLFGETEGFVCAILDQVITTRNFQTFIINPTITGDKCRLCQKSCEIDHITSTCSSVCTYLP